METIMTLVLRLITERYLTIQTLQAIIEAIFCGLLGLTVYVGAVFARENESPDSHLSIRRGIAAIIFSSTFGYALASFFYNTLGWTGFILINSVIGIGVRQLADMTPKEIWKIILNSWVSITKREKVSTEDLSVNAELVVKNKSASKSKSNSKAKASSKSSATGNKSSITGNKSSASVNSSTKLKPNVTNTNNMSTGNGVVNNGAKRGDNR